VIEADERVRGIDSNADRIEADRVRRGSRVPFICQPSRGKAPQTCTLTATQAREWLFKWAKSLSGAGADSARLHLQKDEYLAIEGDEIDLAVARARVALQQRKAKPLKVVYGELLTESAQHTAWILSGCRWSAC
jgi:hypothetical protein